MSQTRREVLGATVAIGATSISYACGTKTPGDGDTGAADSGGTPAPERSAEPAPWTPPGDLDNEAFPSGIQTGDPTPDSVQLSLWTTVEQAELVLLEAQSSGWQEVRRFEGLVPANGHVAIGIDGLDADVAYTIAALDPVMGGWSRPARFRTAVDDEGWRVIEFGATSCLGGNEPWATLQHAADDRLDFFVFLGDTVYADGSVTVEDYGLHWAAARAVSGFQAVTASTAMVATWDDHEVGNNWSVDRLADGQLDAARSAFRAAMPQQIQAADPHRIWRRLNFGAVLDVFVLDCRSERIDGRYISEDQMAWLQDGLATSTARFKVILNSVPITDLYAIFGDGLADDRWDGFPEQRDDILSFIEEAGIEGVLWVAGDVHYGQVGHVSASGQVGSGHFEVFAGPGGSFRNVGADLFAGDPQYLWLSSEWNYVRFRCDPGTGVIDVVHIADDGSVLHEISLQL